MKYKPFPRSFLESEYLICLKGMVRVFVDVAGSLFLVPKMILLVPAPKIILLVPGPKVDDSAGYWTGYFICCI